MTLTLKYLFRGFLCIWPSNEAFRDEFVLLSPSFGSLGFFQNFSSAGPTLSWGRKFSHVFSISLDFFLFRINTAAEQSCRRGDHCRLGWENTEGLQNSIGVPGKRKKGMSLPFVHFILTLEMKSTYIGATEGSNCQQ